MTTQEYLSAPPRIGFIESQSDYKIGARVNEVKYKAQCLRHPVEVTVSTSMVDFGGFPMVCAVTTPVKVGHLLPLGGFGSHCHIDEALTARSAIAAYCEKEGYVVCREVNSWPYAVAVITAFGKGFKGID